MLTRETGYAEIVFVAADLACAGNASDIQGHIVLELLRQLALDEDVADGNTPARLQQPEHFVECELFLRLRDEVHHAVADDAVGRIVRQSDSRNGRLYEGHIAGIRLLLVALSSLEHALATALARAQCHLDALI